MRAAGGNGEGSRRGALIVCCALLPMAVACVTQERYDLMTAQRDELEGTRVRLEREVEHLDAAKTSLQTEREKLFDEFEDQRIAAGQLENDVRRLTRTGTQLSQNLEQTQARLVHREAEISAMRGTYDGLVADLQEEVTAGQIEIERLSSGLNLNLSQGVLFRSGTADVRKSGRAVLRKLAARLSRLSYRVEIIGHTDDVPIGVAYPSNWELAGARASSVVRLLAEEGVDPGRMSAVSRGEFDPIASNETAEGRASNRRIEIRLTPEILESGRDSEPAVPAAEVALEREVEPQPAVALEAAVETQPEGVPAEPAADLRPGAESAMPPALESSATPMPGDAHDITPES